jgi:hypothetical protein
MRQLESGAINEALPVLAVALALGFRGAMYGIATHLHRHLPLSPFGSCLLLAYSSRLMRGSTLVRALWSRRHSMVCLSWFLKRPWSHVLVFSSFMVECWARWVVYHQVCKGCVVCRLALYRGVTLYHGVTVCTGHLGLSSIWLIYLPGCILEK